MDKNCHIPDLLQAVSYVENVGDKLGLKLAKSFTYMTVTSNSIILVKMWVELVYERFCLI